MNITMHISASIIFMHITNRSEKFRTEAEDAEQRLSKYPASSWKKIVHTTSQTFEIE